MSVSLFGPITFASGDCSGAEPFRTATSFPLVGSYHYAVTLHPACTLPSPSLLTRLPLYVAARLGDPPGTSSPHVDIRSHWRTCGLPALGHREQCCYDRCTRTREPRFRALQCVHLGGDLAQGNSMLDFLRNMEGPLGCFWVQHTLSEASRWAWPLPPPGSIGAHLTPWLSGCTCAGDRPAL